MITTATPTWTDVCRLDDILPDTGVAVIHAGRQIALFRIGHSQKVYAVSNRDPFTDANVLARGIVGDRDGRCKVASPLLKHAFDLESGISLDDPAVRIPTYPVRIQNHRVQITTP